MVQNCRIGGHTTAVSYTSVGRGLITNNLLGPNGPYGANTTAITLAGTTANVIVQGNNVNGSTTALSNTASGVNHVEFYNSSATNLQYPVAPAIFSTAGTEAFRISGGDATFADDVTVKGDVVVEKATGVSATVKAKSGASNFEFVYNDGAGAYISNTGSVPMYFYIGGSEKARLDSSGNVGIGATSFGASAVSVLGIKNGTAPGSGVADTVQFYSSDHAAGHTIPSFYCEGTDVVMTGQSDSTSDIRIRVRINGTVYQLLAKAN
jgi:hypothetical protein